MRSQARSRAWLVASVGLWLASLALNAFCLETGRSLNCDNYGAAVLAFGWIETLFIGELGPWVALPWFANPCLLFAWIFALVSIRRAAMVCAAVGGLLALSFLMADSLQISEGGGPSRIMTHGPGYWLWLGSLGLALMSAVSNPGRTPHPRE